MFRPSEYRILSRDWPLKLPYGTKLIKLATYAYDHDDDDHGSNGMLCPESSACRVSVCDSMFNRDNGNTFPQASPVVIELRIVS